MRSLSVLLGNWENVSELIFRKSLEAGGHLVKYMPLWRREKEFLKEARMSQYDLVILAILGLPPEPALRMIAPVRSASDAKVVVFSGVGNEEYREAALRDGAFAFYKLPMPLEGIREALEQAARNPG